MSSIEKLTCRKVPNVLKYHVPNKQTHTHTHTHTHTDIQKSMHFKCYLYIFHLEMKMSCNTVIVRMKT